jgi:methyl-accepting chemotaxis protein
MKVTAEAAQVAKDVAAARDGLNDSFQSAAEEAQHSAFAIIDLVMRLTIGLGISSMALGLALSLWITRSIRSPIVNLTNVMSGLAAGDLAVTISNADEPNEIGETARAVRVFRDNGVTLKTSAAAAERHRLETERERVASEAASAQIQRQQDMVVTSRAAGLDRLSKGDLINRLDQAFSRDYEKPRGDFNATADSLRNAMRTIAEATDGISAGSDQIAAASDDFSRRTEQQAASLEETAAALNLITDTVKTTAAGAQEAGNIVAGTRDAAEMSGQIVRRGVEAMDRIRGSSRKITNIIGVIDEIAFQTNPLALNAGVEAARAGDAGRGVAVVASEVRALAQRSAEAAKEIKVLISDSNVQVEGGVDLVDRAGTALKDIIAKVAEMDVLVRKISASSQDQATSLAEINTAVVQMDQAVQQNAAMVEESTAAAHSLKSETQGLSAMVGKFQIGGLTREKQAVMANTPYMRPHRGFKRAA